MKSKKSKPIRLKAVCLVANKPSGNGRIVTPNGMKLLVATYNSNYIKRRKAQGTLGHVDENNSSNQSANLQMISHKITSLKMVGNKAIAEIELLPTPYGNQVREGILNGVKFGLSVAIAGSAFKVVQLRDLMKRREVLPTQLVTWDRQVAAIANNPRIPNFAEIVAYDSELRSVDIVLDPACRESVLKVLK